MLYVTMILSWVDDNIFNIYIDKAYVMEVISSLFIDEYNEQINHMKNEL